MPAPARKAAPPAAVPTPKVTARELMTAEPFTVNAQNTVVDAATAILSHGVSNAPVVEADFNRRMLAGFISEKDVMQCYASGRLYAEPDLVVGEIMRAHPIGVRPEADLFTLAAIFMQHGFRHLPVVEAGALLGVVSRRDVLKGLFRHYDQWLGEDPATRKTPDMAGTFTPRFLLG
jgi:CBS domain-containing protein